MPVEVFGGSATQVAYPSISFLDITSNSITLVWPTSYFNVPSEVEGVNYDVLAASIYVTDAASNTNTITLPDATQASNGSSFIITNIGASSFQLLKSDTSELIVIPNSPNTSNSFWVQLTDNSSSAGEWKFVQFGAGTSEAQAAALAGNGLVAISNLLNTNIVVQPINSTPYNVLVTDRAKLLLWQTGEGTMNLPLIPTVPAGFYISINNEGGGALIITGAPSTIDGNVSLSVSPGQSLSIISDGTNWWTLGFGQNISNSHFINGDAINPSITFLSDSHTGIYYYISPPPGIGFTVNSTAIANMSENGLIMLAGNPITLQDPTLASSTSIQSNVAYGQLSWTTTGLTAPATLQISGTNTSSTMTLGPLFGLLGSFSISQSSINAHIVYNGNTFLVVDNEGLVNFTSSTTVIFNSILTTFLNPVNFSNTVTFNPPIPITSGGTGQITQQAALNALMPSTPVIGDLLYYNGTNWVRLPIGTAGQVLTVSGGIPQWQTLPS